VPTLINIDTFPDRRRAQDKFPTYAAHMRRLHARGTRPVAGRLRGGPRGLCGHGRRRALAHGRIADGGRGARPLGRPAHRAALSAATWPAREWLRRDGLTEGAPADLVLLDGDPRHDLRVLRAPRAVVLRGVVRSDVLRSGGPTAGAG
jgi:cytosine/adenosine deaminase-related metal-dependent hydrolase